MKSFSIPLLLTGALVAGASLAMAIEPGSSGIRPVFLHEAQTSIDVRSEVGQFLVPGTPTDALRGEVPFASTEDLHLLLQAADWPSHLFPAATRVAGCESGWDPSAVGDAGEIGLFQIHGVHFWRVPPGQDLADPVTNARVALEVWRSEGWRPWSCRTALEE